MCPPSEKVSLYRDQGPRQGVSNEVFAYGNGGWKFIVSCDNPNINCKLLLKIDLWKIEL